MSQLIFKFPFKANYLQKDFYVSSGNFKAYRLIESCPKWPGKWINIYGPNGCGKTHLANILKNKIKTLYKDSEEINDGILKEIENFECLILDNYLNNIEEKLLYSILNQSKQLGNFVLVNSINPINKLKIKLPDLLSRFNSFVDIGIELPDDDLLRVIISKSLSDKQIDLNVRNLEYIIKNIDRSYDKVFSFIKSIDNESLSSGKSINLNLIKKYLSNE